MYLLYLNKLWPWKIFCCYCISHINIRASKYKILHNMAWHGTGSYGHTLKIFASTRKCRYEIVVLHAIWFRNTTPPYQCIFSDSTWKSRSILKVALSFFVGFCMPTSYWPRIKVILLIETWKIIMTLILIILIQLIIVRPKRFLSS